MFKRIYRVLAGVKCLRVCQLLIIVINMVCYVSYFFYVSEAMCRVGSPTCCATEELQKNIMGDVSANQPTSIVEDILFPVNSDTCKAFPNGDKRIWLLVAVVSTYEHFRTRNIIRQTWGSAIQDNAPGNVCLVFFVGKQQSNFAHWIQFQNEIHKYADVTQINKDDTYLNLVHKSIGILKWTHSFVPSVKFILKIDDDVVLNLPNLYYRLLMHSYQSKFIMGYVGRGHKPQRMKTKKNYFPKDHYSGNVIPNYIFGPSYVISGDLVLDLLTVIPRIPLLRIEDIFITAISASYTDAVHIGRCGFLYPKSKNVDHFRWGTSFVSSHSYQPSELASIWNYSRIQSHHLSYSAIFLQQL
ncbi:beta-1,3-galactosyltransferase 5-like [Haliotis rufescens]|uniref:beta-1,3-galactosyltransferase 5-like n=1 Tax=Haliotis rufescens TaxID=6454 RepID=UPI00201F7883|nr:beta-1,3-galactosyltransferase 5-like [Haliotis rufescens]XP_048241657.1 beta-1,3-galactosyltransferase 5-like [Haliotis rufescens]